jgi:aminopeptidase N
MALQAASSPRGSPIGEDLDNPMSTGPTYMGPRSITVSTDALAESALADGINTDRVANHYFGPIPYPEVAITQQSQWSFGQSWPTLIFIPYMAFLDGTTRHFLGLDNTSDFVDQVGPHEFAHQWWGHYVGWQGYRDQWLSEGFAEFTAALVIQHTQGMGKYNRFWERARRYILEKGRGASLHNDEAGPITEGWRLATRRAPEAYQAIVYDKGAYVLHMLRMMMRNDGSRDPDERFVAMMKDFVATFADKNPSTRDFQDVVERHMIPAMNAGGDGTMKWFFDEWVSGTDIPRYVSKLDIEKAGGDQYRLVGTLRQQDVSKDFRAPVQIYVDLGKGQILHLGTLLMVGDSTNSIDTTFRSPRKPRHVLLNALHDVLSQE